MQGSKRTDLSRRLSPTLVSLISVCVLLLATPVAAGYRTQASNLPYSVSIPSGYYNYFPLTADSSSSTVTITVSSNTAVSTALMSSSQFASFNDSETDLSDSLYLVNATTAQDSLHEPAGKYYLVFYSYGANANITYNYQVYPVDPFFSVPLPSPEPTGVASYGIYNSSGNAVPYQVETSEVVGVADVSALQAYNATAGSVQSNISGATLQLNTVLVVNESGGLEQSYWVQNTPDFVTMASTVAFADNLWNFSVSGVLTNSTMTSPDGGAVYSYPNDGTTSYYYSYEGSNMTYSLPFGIALLANATVEDGVGVNVLLGAQLFQNGTGTTTPVDWFDSVLIHDPTAESAYFFVSGNKVAPDGLFYDTELVFAGEANGEATDFTQMSSSLGIFYENSTNGTLVSFPSLYSFGGDTEEAADNLQVTYSGNGFSQVETGTPDYVYLGQASGSISFPLSGTTVVSSSSSTGQSTTSSSSSTASSTSSSTASSATTTTSLSSSTASVSTALGPTYVPLVVAAAAAFFAALLGSRARVRDAHRRAR